MNNETLTARIVNLQESDWKELRTFLKQALEYAEKEERPDYIGSCIATAQKINVRIKTRHYGR